MREPAAAFGVQQEAWMDFARCKGQDPSIFILDPGSTTAEAAKFCAECAVCEPCEDYAKRTRSVGIWGGKFFASPYAKPVTLRPVRRIEDMRPVVVHLPSGNQQSSGILGSAISFRSSGILGNQ